MNLYKINFSHTAPKDRKEGLQTFLLADNEEQVYKFIDENFNYGSWKDADEEGDSFDIYDDNYNVIGKESFKEKIIRIKGQMHDEDYDYSDAYYGITLYGWELLKENITDDVFFMVDLGLVASIK